MALVSILIPCHNAGRWVGQAIESALRQTWAHKEVRVVDDGSTDDSLAVIQSFRERVHWETGPNQGATTTRNRLLELARGDWLQYLDADDYLLPEKVKVQMEFLSSRENADVLFSPITLEHTMSQRIQREIQPIPEPHDPWVLLARWYLPQTGSALWRRRALIDIGGWKNGQPCCQEHELYLRLLMADKRFVYCPHPGAVYRQWSDQTLSKKNVSEVHLQRLEIERRAETFLRTRNELTSQRQAAINQARFETARSAWQYDPAFAMNVMAQVLESQPGFTPETCSAAPAHYRLALRILGFRATETLADIARALVPRGSLTGSSRDCHSPV
jgi:glycosyltransferase involved in cell wall biosynthesis